MSKQSIQAVIMAGAAAFGWPLATAGAADLPPVYDTPSYQGAPEVQPVEIGTGWYLRGDVGYNFNDDSGIYVDSRSTYATGNGTGIRNVFDNSRVTGGVGVGYQFTDLLRGDITADWLAHGSFDDTYQGGCPVFQYDANDVQSLITGSCRSDSDGGLDVYNFMANAYVDLGTYVGLTPYIGAGIGVANVRANYSESQVCNENDNPDIDCFPNNGTAIRGKSGDSQDCRREELDLAAFVFAGGRCGLPGHRQPEARRRLPLRLHPEDRDLWRKLRQGRRLPPDPRRYPLLALVGGCRSIRNARRRRPSGPAALPSAPGRGGRKTCGDRLRSAAASPKCRLTPALPRE